MEVPSQLIQDCIAGKHEAQSRLYTMFAPKLLGVCLRYSRDDTEAEDILHDGFIKIFNKIGSFRHEGSFEGWMRRIMVNIALEKFRKTSVLYTAENITEFESDLSNDENEIIDGISADDLLKLVQQLPPKYRMVFNLYVMEGMQHKDISAELGITEGTSKSNLARARNILRKKIKDYFGMIESVYSK